MPVLTRRWKYSAFGGETPHDPEEGPYVDLVGTFETLTEARDALLKPDPAKWPNGLKWGHVVELVSGKIIEKVI